MDIEEAPLFLCRVHKRWLRSFVDDQAVMAASLIPNDGASRDCVVPIDAGVFLAEWAGPRVRVNQEPKTVFCGQSEFARKYVGAQCWRRDDI